MKRIIMISICWLIVSASLKAQTFNELFRQKKTQIKYLTKQIAELQVYLGYVKKGYTIVSSGLNTFHNIKNGEFSLHDLYYTSLVLVNPRIRNSPTVLATINHLKYILKATNSLQVLLRIENLLPKTQKDYFSVCLKRLLEDIEQTHQELIELITDKNLQLTDNERLDRLNNLNKRSTSQLAFTHQFSAEVFMLIQSLQREELEAQTRRQLHDLP